MAGRRFRYDAEYFPFKIKEGKTFTILQQKYGNEGLGFFTNLMRLLTRTPHHFVIILDEVDDMYFWAQCGTDEEKGKPILELLIKTGKIDKKLWNKNIVCCPDLIESLKPLYQKRTNPISEPCHILNWALKFDFSDKTGSEIEFPAAEIHKGEYSIVKYSKESIFMHRNKIFEFFYFKNFKNSKKEVDRFIKYYTKTGGNDKNGNPIKDYMAAAEFWKPKDAGNAYASSDLLKRWRKVYDAFYKGVTIGEDDDPVLLNVVVKLYTEIDLSLKVSSFMEWKLKNVRFEDFRKAIFVGFGQVEISIVTF